MNNPFSTSSGIRGTSDSTLPDILTNRRQLIDVIQDAWAAIHEANEPNPFLFQRNGSLVKLRPDANGLVIYPLKNDDIYSFMIRSANWYVIKGKTAESAPPPRNIAPDMLALPPSRLPHLESVTMTPIFGHQGEIITIPGYYEADRLYYFPGDHNMPAEVPMNPVPEAIEQARNLIVHDLLVDFPFASETDCAHAVAALLLPFVRRMIVGCTPLHVIVAKIPGAGKSLLCSVISLIFTGNPCASQTLPRREEEVRKTFTAELSAGRHIVLLDNAQEFESIDSPSLASVLTAERWTGRLLGHTKMVTVANKALWLLTGNNVTLSAELRRRSVPVRLIPDVARPEHRSGFRHPNLLGWVKENRGELIHSALVLIQSWIAAGRPMAARRLGSFEVWSQTMGGILENAGIDGFLGNIEEFFDTDDPLTEMWEEFVFAWWAAFGESSRGVNELNALCHRQGLMESVRGNGALRSQQTALGKALYGSRDRIFGNQQILLHQDRGHHGKMYRLREVARDPEAPNNALVISTEVPEVPQVPGDGEKPEGI